jgi:hypothetical protein
MTLPLNTFQSPYESHIEKAEHATVREETLPL